MESAQKVRTREYIKKMVLAALGDTARGPAAVGSVVLVEAWFNEAGARRKVATRH